MSEGLSSYALVAIGAVVVPAWLGLACIRILGVDRAEGMRVSLAYGYLVGHLVLAPVVFLWLVAGQPFAGWVLPAAAAVAGTLLWWRSPKRLPSGVPRETSILWIVVPLLVVSVPVLDLDSRVNLQPLLFGDESLIWAAKAKVWFGLPFDDIDVVLRDYVAHPDYPMWNPLVHCLAFASVGHVLHWENRLPVQGFAIALLLLLSSTMTRRSHPGIAAIVLLAFGGTAFATQASDAGADIMLAFATLACVDALLRAKETGEAVWWRLACCALAGMLASKNEGAMLALVVLFAFGLHWLLTGARPLGNLRPYLQVRRGLWLLVPASVVIGHATLNRAYGLSNDLLSATNGRGMLARILHQFEDYAPRVWSFFYHYCTDMSRSRWLLPATALAACMGLLCNWRRARTRHALLLVVVVAGSVCGYLLVFIGTNAASLDWHLQTAFDRILLHILPVATVALAVLIWPRDRLASGRERELPSPPMLGDGQNQAVSPTRGSGRRRGVDEVA